MAQLRADFRERYVFCDESGLANRFFVLGSLSGEVDPNALRSQIESIKAAHALNGEIKWESFPKSFGKFYSGYMAVASLFFESPLHYKALIIDTRLYALNNPSFTGKSYDIGYFQFYLVLLFHGIIRHTPLVNTYIHLHTPAYELRGGAAVIEKKINEAAREAGFPNMAGGSCCRVSFGSAKKDSLLQLTDILTGMISAVWNNKIAHQTKQDLVRFCGSKIECDITMPSVSRHVHQKFNRWVFKASEDKEKAKQWPALYPPTE